MDEAMFDGETPLWLQATSDRDTLDGDPDDEAEPLEDDHYPDNDEYEDVTEEDEP